MTSVQSARNYEELLKGPVETSPYDFAMLFKGEGFFGRQRAKKRLKLLKAIDVKLRHMLENGEKVYFVTPGTTVSWGERLFVGWAAYYLNMRAMVFTSRRILFLHIDYRQRPLELVSQLPYATIASVKSRWNGLCEIKLLNRSTLNFQHVPRADRKFLVDFLADIVQLTNAPFEQKRGVEHLCPHCFVFVPEFPSACPSCAGGFKSAKTAGLLSLLFPGFGDWYLGHKCFALLEIFGTAILWFVLVVSPFLGGTDAEAQPVGMEYWITVGVILLLAHATDAMMTHHFGKKGHYPSGVAQLPASLPHVVAHPKPDAPLNKLTIRRTNPPTG